jgi:hypothetical protein
MKNRSSLGHRVTAAGLSIHLQLTQLLRTLSDGD